LAAEPDPLASLGFDDSLGFDEGSFDDELESFEAAVDSFGFESDEPLPLAPSEEPAPFDAVAEERLSVL